MATTESQHPRSTIPDPTAGLRRFWAIDGTLLAVSVTGHFLADHYAVPQAASAFAVVFGAALFALYQHLSRPDPVALLPLPARPADVRPLHAAGDFPLPDRLREHMVYLARMRGLSDRPVPSAVTDRALAIWKECVRTADPRRLLPAAGATDDGRLIYAWDAAGIHLEAEVVSDGPTEWYYQNDATGSHWSEDTDAVPPRAAEAIREIAGAANP